jgi:hypothetical protein
MNILSFFTDGGIPRTGLNPTIKIIDIADSTSSVNFDVMTEISDGWYKYDFVNYDYKKEYAIVCDGGNVLYDSERYLSYASDNSNHEIAQIVWDADRSSHRISGTFGELLQTVSDDLKRTLGLIHENIMIDMPTYDDDNNLVTARVRIYSNAGSVGSTNDVIGSYLISSTGIGPGKFTNWSQIKL